MPSRAAARCDDRHASSPARGIAGAASNIAWILFVVFLVLAVISLLRGRRV